MVTYARLEAEAVWNAETVPPALAAMGRQVRVALGLPASAVGFKGDNNHLSGAHRSRNWILNSQYCTDTSYTVTYPQDRLGDGNWISGFDISAPQHILLPMCQRLDAAVRGGQLEELAAWYGNINGDQRVDGYNNVLNRVASADSSHLTHLHGTVLRQHANNAGFMQRLARVLTGDLGEENMLLIKQVNDPAVYVSDGLQYRHLTSGAALLAAMQKGFPLVEVPTFADLEALAGIPWAPATVTLTPADRDAIVAELKVAFTQTLEATRFDVA